MTCVPRALSALSRTRSLLASRALSAFGSTSSQGGVFVLTQLIRRSEERRRHTVPSPSVAYPGPAGSHTAAAAAALFPSAEPLASYRAVAEAVSSGEVAYG